MATYFRNVLKTEIGTTEVLAVNTAGNARATLIGLSLTNLIDCSVLASIRVENATDLNDLQSAYYIKNVIIPPNQSLRVINGGEKLVLSTSMNVYISSSEADSLDLVASYVEII